MHFQVLNKRATVELTGKLESKKNSLILDGFWSVNGQRNQKFKLSATTEGILDSIEGDVSFIGSFKLGHDRVDENASLRFEKQIDGYNIRGDGSNKLLGCFSISGRATRTSRKKSLFKFELKKEYVCGARLLLEEERDAGEVVFNEGRYTYFSYVDGNQEILSEDDVRAIKSSSSSGKAASKRRKQKFNNGTVVKKFFLDDEGINEYEGHIDSFDTKTGLYTIHYTDDDVEEVEEEVVNLIEVKGLVCDISSKKPSRKKARTLSRTVHSMLSVQEKHTDYLNSAYTTYFPAINRRVSQNSQRLDEFGITLENGFRHVQQDISRMKADHAKQLKALNKTVQGINRTQVSFKGELDEMKQDAKDSKESFKGELDEMKQDAKDSKERILQLELQHAQAREECSQLRAENAQLRGRVDQLDRVGSFSPGFHFAPFCSDEKNPPVCLDKGAVKRKWGC